MQRLLICCFLVWTHTAAAQFNYFVYHARRILSTTDSTFRVETSPPGPSEVNTFTDSVTTLRTLLDYTLTNLARKHDSLQRSTILQELAALTEKRYRNIGKKPDRWRTIRKQLQRSFLGSKCRFGMISVYTFQVPLLKTEGNFYYDRKGPDGGYNIYDGKRKPKPQKTADGEEEDPEVTPLRPYTEEELVRLIEKRLRNVRCAGELQKGLASYYGYSVAIDKRSLGSGKKVPQARVIVLLGSRRMQRVKPKTQ